MFLVLVPILFLSLVACSAPSKLSQEGHQKLSVALYPYIPYTTSELAQRIKTEFEQRNPWVDLTLVIDSKAFDPYKADDEHGNKRWWIKSPNDGGYHLAEVDAILLGELVQKKAIRSWTISPDQSDWHHAGAVAGMVNKKLYGIPHWLCGFFIFSRNQSVEHASTLEELLQALHGLTTDIPNLAGRIAGSWTLSGIYLDSWADTYGPESVSSALVSPIDKTVTSSLRKFAAECRIGDKNPCLKDGSYDKDEDQASIDFAMSKTNAFIGFSEQLSMILGGDGLNREEIRISSAPLGNGNHPLVFVDTFVLHHDCDQHCEKAALAFVNYMNSPETFEWILLHRDAGEKSVARYLIPINLRTYESPAISTDPFFGVIKDLTMDASAYPNAGLMEMRKNMEDAIQKELTSSSEK